MQIRLNITLIKILELQFQKRESLQPTELERRYPTKSIEKKLYSTRIDNGKAHQGKEIPYYETCKKLKG